MPLGHEHVFYMVKNASLEAFNFKNIPVGSDFCHGGCAYAVLQAAQRKGVCSYISDTVYQRETLHRSREKHYIRVGHNPSSGFFLSRYYHGCPKGNNIHLLTPPT